MHNKYGEELVAKVLKKYKIKYETQKTFDWLINPKTNRHLYFDFFLSKQNILLEIDGDQHRKVVVWQGMTKTDAKKCFKNTLERDLIKDKLCKKNKIRLIRIPYVKSDLNKLETDLIKIINKEL